MPRKASVFDHFSAPTPSGTVGNCQAKCHHCQAVIAGSVQATSNFRRHLMVGVESPLPGILSSLGACVAYFCLFPFF